MTLDTAVLDELISDGSVAACERGPVGNGQETWFVTLEDGRQLVIRRTAPSGPLDWTDREAEFAALGALAGSHLPVPEVLWFEPDGGRLDRAAFAMSRLPGAPVRREEQTTKNRVAAEIGTLLARLHRLDPQILGRTVPPSVGAASRAELDRWRAQYENRRRGSIPVMGALFAWLESRVPEADRPVAVLWGDAGPHNALHVDGVVTGLLDWELSHLGDPLEDLGGAVWAVEAVADPELTIAAYEAESGRAVDRTALEWFTVFASVTRGVMLVNGIANYLDGASHGQNHAGLGLQLLPETLRQAARHAGWPDPPPPAEVSAPPPVDESRLRPDGPESVEGVARFLTEDVLPAVDDRVLRRGLKTAAALLETAALRHALEAAVFTERSHATQRLLDDLGEAGVDTAGGLEPTAARIERDPRLAGHRDRVRAHVLADLAAQERLILPLLLLYGRA